MAKLIAHLVEVIGFIVKLSLDFVVTEPVPGDFDAYGSKRLCVVGDYQKSVFFSALILVPLAAW